MRPIDADELIKTTENISLSEDSPIQVATDYYQYITEAPTLTYNDIVPHGQWIEDKNGEVVCSECGIRIPEMYSNADTIIKSECRFCHSCGAKMDGEE